jgi:hypothetical protein
MKKTLRNWMLVISLVFLVVSCDKVLDQLELSFDVKVNEIEFTINPAKSGEIVEDYYVVNEDLKAQIEEEGGNIDNLEDVFVDEATVSIQSGADSFDALESFEVFIKADGLADKKIAWMDAIPANVTSVSPTITSDDLKDYISSDAYTVTFIGVLSADITQDVVLNAEIVFDVNL